MSVERPASDSFGDATPVPRDAPARRPAPDRGLTGRQKAAIIIRLLLEDGARPTLHAIPEAMQAELARQFTHMGAIDFDTISAVVEEFIEATRTVGLSFPHDLDGALSSLDGVISTAAASRLRRETGRSELSSPWDRVNAVETEKLADAIRRESSEIAAVILSKLKTSKAAEILGLLPGDMARRITYSISLTGSIDPETVHRIGLSLATELGTEPPRAFSLGPVGRVGEILNAAKTSTRESVLEGLEAEDEAFAEQVKKSLFTFADIARRVDPRDVPRIHRELDQDDLVLVKAGASGSNEVAIEFLLSGISQRLADMIRSAAQDRGRVGEADPDAAMTRIVHTVREMERQGDLHLGLPDD